MIIYRTVRFTATHQHRVPPYGELCIPHTHDWSFTAYVSDSLHPTYGWVMDFDEMGKALRDVVGKGMDDIHNATCERILLRFVGELAYLLGDGPTIVRAELAETGSQGAVYLPDGAAAVSFGHEVDCEAKI